MLLVNVVITLTLICLLDEHDTCYSYTMACPPVRGDDPRALASGFSYVQLEKTWYNYFIPPTSM